MLSMNPSRQYRFVLLDFGHPMSVNTIKNIINSLENILVFNMAFSQNRRETNFGISILNSDSAIFNFSFEFNAKKNYDSVAKHLHGFLKKSCERVTVQEYKDLLRSSLEGILCELQKKYKMEINGEFIQIAVVSKKTAWVLSDILKSVTSKLSKSILSAKNFKIIQISNETHWGGTEERNNCMFCPDDTRDLNRFFKDWLLNPQQHLRILVSRDANLDIECEVEDCVVNPFAFCSKFGDVWPGSGNPFGTSTQVCNLEIINRLPVSGLCPTLVFGTPRRIRATESEPNVRLFKELCQELSRTGEGLLAKSPTEHRSLITFHFLTSDGDMILMNDVAPDELQLPKREDFSNCVDFHEDNASVVRDCLQKIQFLDEFKAENFSSGVYEFLRERNKRTCAFPRKTSPKNDDDKEERKRQKLSSETEADNVHPALLSSKVVEKYRKIHKRAFNLPELSKEFSL